MAARTKRHPLSTWRGSERPYDLIAEGTIAVIIVAVLCVLAAILWGSPDGGLTRPGAPKSPAGQAFSARYWDVNDPSDLAQTAVQELAGGTVTAGYGPPFNQTTGASQEIIGIKPAEIAKAIFQGSQQQLSTDTTLGTMFFSDGTLWSSIAEAQGVGGDQWGVMNELWNFPGQVWLWLYAGMYQIPALKSNNANLDLDVGLLMIVGGFLLPMFAPWTPVINRLPRWIPLYKIIYRKYYASMADELPPPEAELKAEPGAEV